MSTQFALRKTSSSWKQWVHQLEDLKALEKLKGSLKIKVRLLKNGTKAVKDSSNRTREGGYLRSKKHLDHINITFSDEDDEVIESVGYKELLLEDLHPPSNLKVLELSGYNGLRTPNWMGFLPNLVRLELLECEAIQHLSNLKNLTHLKVLDLENLPILQYIESSFTVSNVHQLFFPSLERVRLYNLQNLQGWSRSEMNNGSSRGVQFSFHSISQLKTLFIRRCPSLTSISMCPRLEDLNLWKFNEGLHITIDTHQHDRKLEASSTSSLSCDNTLLQYDPGNSSCISELRVVRVDNVSWLKSLPMKAFQNLTYMEVNNDKEVECLEKIEEVFNNSSSSLRSLCIEYCPKLRILYRGLEKLTALEILYISRCPNLQISEDIGEIGGFRWQFLHQNLRSLQLRDLPKLVKLPNGMQFLTTLQNLQIANCKSLESLPDWMPKLTSLSRLDVHNCSAHLRERCQYPDGEDWPKIQHISSFTLL